MQVFYNIYCQEWAKDVGMDKVFLHFNHLNIFFILLYKSQKKSLNKNIRHSCQNGTCWDGAKVFVVSLIPILFGWFLRVPTCTFFFRKTLL